MAWSLVFTDDFTRADGDIGADWSTPAASNPWQVDTNRARGGETYETTTLYTTELGDADMAVEVDAVASSNGSDHWIVFRAADDSTYHVLRQFGQELYFDGSYQSGGSYWGTVPADPTFRMEVEGSTIRWLVNGTERWTGTATRSGGTGSNSVGMRGTSSVLHAAFRAYEVESGTPSGSGSVTAEGSLTATGETVRSGSGTTTGVGTLDAAGQTDRSGAGTVAATGSLSATGSTTRAGSGTVSGEGSLSATGSAPSTVASGSGTTAGVGSLTATGQTTRSGSGATVGVAQLAATGTTIRSGSGTVVGIGSLSATGQGDPAVTPTSRIWTIDAETRVDSIAAEARVTTIATEDRTITP